MKLQALGAQQIIKGAKVRLEALWALRSRFGAKSARVLLAHPDERYETVEERVNVILSPAYYWYKHSPVALKNVRAAKRIAPSIFFSWIPEGAYRFFAFEEEGGFGFIACNLDEITARLAAQGLSAQWIERIHFAQTALKEEGTALRVGSAGALSKVGGVWVALPLRYAKDAMPYDTTPRPLAGPFLRVARVRESGMNRKSFMAAAALFTLLIAAQAIDLWRMKKATAQLETERLALLEGARLPQTLLQLESIERRLTTIATAQTGIRERLSDLLGLSFTPSKMETLRVVPGRIEAEFSTVSAEQEAALAGALRNRFPNAALAASNGRLSMALTW